MHPNLLGDTTLRLSMHNQKKVNPHQIPSNCQSENVVLSLYQEGVLSTWIVLIGKKQIASYVVAVG